MVVVEWGKRWNNSMMPKAHIKNQQEGIRKPRRQCRRQLMDTSSRSTNSSNQINNYIDLLDELNRKYKS